MAKKKAALTQLDCDELNRQARAVIACAIARHRFPSDEGDIQTADEVEGAMMVAHRLLVEIANAGL